MRKIKIFLKRVIILAVINIMSATSQKVILIFSWVTDTDSPLTDAKNQKLN